MSDSTTDSRLGSRLLLRGLLAVGVVAVGVGIWRLWKPPDVRTVTLERRDIVSTLAVVGRVRAPARAGLGAAVAGTVTQVRAAEGDRVAAGDVVVVLENREALAAVAQAEAALAEVAEGTAEAVAQAEREAEQAQRDLERIRAVFEQGGLTRQRLEQAEQRAADAVGRLRSLRAGTSGGEGAEPAAVARARATLEAARARLATTRIRAPTGGTILSRAVEPGDAVTPGRILVEMAVDGPLELVANPGEEHLAQLAVGARATASADAFPERVFGASVALIGPAVDPTQGTVEVRLAIPDPPEYLRPEMTVSVNIDTGRRSGAHVLPEAAVQGLGTDAPWVALVERGRLVRREVEVGLRAGGHIEILSGVDPAERVALVEDGGPAVGDRVRVQDPTGG